MKVAVIKLGSRISFNANDTSGANGEARSICKMLKQGGADVHIYTKILKKDNLVEDYSWHNLSDAHSRDGKFGEMFWGLPNTYTDQQTTVQPEHSGYDALIVLNGNVNFFGGAEDKEQLMNYVAISKFCGPVFYIYCDPELTLKQVWPSVAKKPWGTAWNRNDLEITRDDIIYLSQPHDVEKVIAGFSKNEVVPAKVIHFPFEQFPCLNDFITTNPSPEVDLSYGGTMRGGKREKKMAKFYFGHPEDISVEMFGKIEAVNFTAKHIYGLRFPIFSGPVKYDEMLPKMNKAMCHVVLGDPYYEKINDLAQRAYESIWSSVITFIDKDLDSLRRVYGKDKILADFLYVGDKEELTEKIQLIKSDPILRQQIIDDQIKAIDFNPLKYCIAFVDLIKQIKQSRK